MGGMTLETVLLICDDEQESSDLLSRLWDAGHAVLGPVATTGMALAIAAQHSPTLALVARPPAGRRGTGELTQHLMRTWGVGSVVAKGGWDAPADVWQGVDCSPRPGQVARLRKALGAGWEASNA